MKTHLQKEMKTLFTLGILVIMVMIYPQHTYAQNNVGINGTPDASAALDVKSGSGLNQGVLIPPVALTATNAALPLTLPAPTLLVYNTATAGVSPNNVYPGYYYNAGTALAPNWVRLMNQLSAWQTIGNSGTTASTSAIGTAANNNFIGTTDATDFSFATSNLERLRIKADGSIGVGTLTTVGNTLLTINASTNSFRHGINMTYAGSGTIGSTAYGIDIDAFTNSNQNVRGFRYRNSTTGNGAFYGVGSELTATNIVSGYLGYRNGSGLSYGLYGVNGSNASYVGTNANTWALFSQGRAVISSESSPTSPLGTDLEVRNTTTGGGAPATFSLRQTTSVLGSGNVLANINFGDNHQTGPQAQIQVLRGATGGTGDLPTTLVFSTTPDASSTLTERLRITNTGAIAVNGAANTGTTGQVLTSTGNAPPTWQSPYGGNIQSAVGSTDININSTTFATMTGMDITFTPRHNTVYVNFGASGYLDALLDPMAYVDFRIYNVTSGTVIAGTSSVATDHDDVSGSLSSFNVFFSMYPVTVTAGVSTRIRIEWRRDGVTLGTVYNNCNSEKDYCHRNLTIFD